MRPVRRWVAAPVWPASADLSRTRSCRLLGVSGSEAFRRHRGLRGPIAVVSSTGQFVVLPRWRGLFELLSILILVSERFQGIDLNLKFQFIIHVRKRYVIHTKHLYFGCGNRHCVLDCVQPSEPPCPTRSSLRSQSAGFGLLLPLITKNLTILKILAAHEHQD